MVQVLSRNGYNVVAADSGEEALQRIGELEGAIDLLLSDVVMGELSGPELAESLQAATSDPARAADLGHRGRIDHRRTRSRHGRVSREAVSSERVDRQGARPAVASLAISAVDLRLEAVADAANGLDPLRVVGVGFDLCAKASDVLGHRRFVLPLARGGPDVFEQLRPGVHLARESPR